ncbi:unnamed protein product [Lota lota]
MEINFRGKRLDLECRYSPLTLRQVAELCIGVCAVQMDESGPWAQRWLTLCISLVFGSTSPASIRPINTVISQATSVTTIFTEG